MPWTADDMKKKGAKDAAKAARIANAILRETGNEGLAIRVALARANIPAEVRR